MTSNFSYATIEIQDAILKFNLYLQKLSELQKALPDPECQEKCKKIIRLCLQNFLKYHENQEYCKQLYQILKSSVYKKGSYYILCLFDLSIKNNKYFLRNGKRQVESMFKSIWENVWTQFDNRQKIQNLKVMARCWGYIYGEKLQENLRKWLDNKYLIKKLDLNLENQKQLKDVYGERKQCQKDKNPKKEEKLNELLQKFDSIIYESYPDQNLSSNSKRQISSIEPKRSNMGGVPTSLLQALEL